MTDQEKAARLMLRMGFPETEGGPYVTELRSHILGQVRRGMTDRSGGTWRDDDILEPSRGSCPSVVGFGLGFRARPHLPR